VSMNKMCAISSAISFLISVDMDGERPLHLYQLGLSPFSQAGLDESGPSRRPSRSYRDKQRVRTPLSGAAAANSSSVSPIGTWPRITSGFTRNCSAGHRLKQQPRVACDRARNPIALDGGWLLLAGPPIEPSACSPSRPGVSFYGQLKFDPACAALRGDARFVKIADELQSNCRAAKSPTPQTINFHF
jgi:hypothetical protein